MTFFRIGLTLFFLHSTCFADLVIISLGENCNVAIALSKHNLRKQAFPFDWNITPFHSLTLMFSDDFANLLKPEELFLRDDAHTVINRFYGIEFAHDFPTYIISTQDEEGLTTPVPGPIKPDFLDALPNVKEKYDRRIERLYTILNGEDEVLFIRHNHHHISKEEIIEFYDFIQWKFPRLNFTLVVWGYEEEMKEDWEHPQIKTFQLIRGNSIGEFYESLFQTLNLIHL